jgi:carboxymethylenebutenolidase
MVIHEWYGLTPWVKEGAERLAGEGYVALAIDLYRGKVAGNPDEAHQLMRGVPEDRASRDLAAAHSYLAGRKDVIGKKIGSVGWCMGGGYSLQAAVQIPELAAAVVCYGRLVTDSTAIAGIGASILGIFGGQDKGISPESAMEFEGTAKGMKKDVSVTVYPEAGHAFMNPGNAGGYREADAKDAWARILAFLADKFDNHH